MKARGRKGQDGARKNGGKAYKLSAELVVKGIEVQAVQSNWAEFGEVDTSYLSKKKKKSIRTPQEDVTGIASFLALLSGLVSKL